ncbi:hypothetical protein BYT27DRAFT_7103406 [Phlegmacium glaucopus]|nr:hypothetical protein BYT27DRAFT_7103406 [Phlegmacium glaucopus]
MSNVTALSRPHKCGAWTRERLLREHAIALACAVKPSSASSYSSALTSYLNFCSIHSFPIKPTPNTLSFFAVYMSHYIKPRSINSYLSGICNQLKPFSPNVRTHRRHWLVSKSLEGCQKMFPTPINRKRPITHSELSSLSLALSDSPVYDDKIFLAILLTSFHGLIHLQDYRKVIICNTVIINPKSYQFLLPGHKADRFFEGSIVLIQATQTHDDLWLMFSSYITYCDRIFKYHPELWLKADGTIPTRTWFLQHLFKAFPGNVGGHSLRAGGATALAEAGLPSHIIQAIGHWSSDAIAHQY